ncbi:MEDS domain-containing protein [uncultured Paraglaciecola sp.]|uniref:MEDS domain-containing protein n=1 Tax=uncultured Paraglaciecola sp. TaxID=1765024 RepID=UPI0025D91176|nr:MEDS domain-containing protein [uncultured Paraglaciecola sp.]
MDILGAMSNLKKFLTITEAAGYLKVSKTSLRRWTNNGGLPCYRVGLRNERRFLLSDLVVFMSDSSKSISQDDSSSIVALSKYNQPRKHVCTYYKSSRDQWQKFRTFFLEHVNNPKSKVVYIFAGEEADVKNLIKFEGLNPDDLIERGLLTLCSTNESYLLGREFDIDRMLNFWKEIIKDATKGGIKKLLLTGEMGWASSGAKGCELLIPYEEALDNFLQGHAWVTVVCQYPVHQFSGSIVYDNLCIHTQIQ